MDVVTLSRIQFGLTAGFHYIFPPISIGLGLALVVIEGLSVRTGQALYREMARFWVKVFALVFSLGVATGIVMEFQFGTNWSTYSRYVGDVFGSPLAAEGIFAFFLESSFLAVVVFGWDRVSKGAHYFSTCMVALGSMLSAVWIVVANSWQQTPAGYAIVQTALGERAQITNFWEMVFNPSSVDRLVHVLFGAFLSGAFLLTSVAAYCALKRRNLEFAKATMRIGLWMAVSVSLGQLVSGHGSAGNVSTNQPAKLAAMEGHWRSDRPMDLSLLGWVDERRQTTHSLAIPGGASWLVTQDASQTLLGLDNWPPQDRPPVQAVFQTYHLMILLGGAMIVLSLLGALMTCGGRLFRCRPLLWVFVVAVGMPFLANESGWMAAELGRQPWVVYEKLRTVDAASRVTPVGHVWASLVLFTLVYALLLALFVYLLVRVVKAGPDEVTP